MWKLSSIGIPPSTEELHGGGWGQEGRKIGSNLIIEKDSIDSDKERHIGFLTQMRV